MTTENVDAVHGDAASKLIAGRTMGDHDVGVVSPPAKNSLAMRSVRLGRTLLARLPADRPSLYGCPASAGPSSDTHR